MSLAIDPVSSKQCIPRCEDDELSVDTSGSFLGDIRVLTTLLSGASPNNVYSSQSNEYGFGIDSDNSFVGYIDGVYSFRTSNSSGSSTDEQAQVQSEDVLKYDYTVATSQSTEDSNNPDVTVKYIDEATNGTIRKKKKSFKAILSSLRRNFCCASVKKPTK